MSNYICLFQILRGFSSVPHTIAHLEFLVIWSMLVLRTTNYWIHEGESHLLPEQWIYVTQSLGYLCQVYTTLFLKMHFYLLICSFFIIIFPELACVLWTNFFLDLSFGLQKKNECLVECHVRASLDNDGIPTIPI